MYRSWYAAHRLPLSIPLSRLQKFLGVPAYNVDLFSKILGGMFYVCGCFIAAFPLLKREDSSSIFKMLFIAAGTAVFPSFLLGSRTGMLFWGVLFCLFWLTVCLIFRHLETGQNKYLYASAVPMAYFVLNPYPTLVALPLVIVLMAVTMKRFVFVLKNKHSYFAVGLCVLLIVAGHCTCAWFVGEDFWSYWQKVINYRETRQLSVSLEAQFFGVPLTAKFKKLLNQQLLFRHDTLGDRFRSDEEWTLGAYHYPWLLLSPVVFWGFLVSLRRRDRFAHLYGSVLVAVHLFFLTISFPEGRYVLVVIPSYFYFLQIGLDSLVKRQATQVLVCAISLLLFGGYTYYLIICVYNPYMKEKWFDRDGMKEVVIALPRHQAGENEYIRLPHANGYQEWLYLMMLSNFRAQWVSPDEAFRKQIDEGRPGNYYYIDTPEAPRFPSYREAGFEEVSRVISQERKIEFSVLRRKVPSSRENR